MAPYTLVHVSDLASSVIQSLYHTHRHSSWTSNVVQWYWKFGIIAKGWEFGISKRRSNEYSRDINTLWLWLGNSVPSFSINYIIILAHLSAYIYSRPTTSYLDGWKGSFKDIHLFLQGTALKEKMNGLLYLYNQLVYLFVYMRRIWINYRNRIIFLKNLKI